MERLDYLTLANRANILLINVGISYAAFVFAAGRWLPTGGLESVWLLSAFALWFLSLLSAPWFVPPRDALANALGAICILVTAELTETKPFYAQLETVRWLAVAYCFVVGAFSLAALFLHNPAQPSRWGRLFFRLTAMLGKGEIFYTPPALISIVGAYNQHLPSVLWLVCLWTFLIIVQPVERLLLAIRYWRADSSPNSGAASVGIIERIDHPNIVRVKLHKAAGWKPQTLYTAAMSDGDQRFVLALFAQVQGTEVVGTGLCIAPVADRIDAEAGHVHSTHDADQAATFIENLSGTKGAELVGFTVENSNIGVLRFEVAASTELSEGDVVFTRLGGHEVLYQILDAHTAEESFDQNPRGTHIVHAAQLGRYDPATGFTKHPWLSGMNTPLFWAKSREFPQTVLSDREFVVGSIPSTNIGVAANIDDLVEFHTAILGVTGTGKTELALDVVRQAASRGIKVFCVDFTGEYRSRLSDLSPIFPAPTAKQILDLETKLFDVETGPYGAGKEKAALSEHIKTVRTTTEAQVNAFLESDTDKLAILELNDIANTKASLRLTEQYLSTIMAWARKHRKARQILIVLEEAHTIIPETFSSGFDHETQWVVSRIGQIALQGRKYGVGLLVISQRTALVSKTILSQCNTFLTHSLIDQTSLNFLESVYSSEHTRTIPNLRRLEFLAFGKAVRAERPVLLRREYDPAKKAASDSLRQPLPKKEESQAAQAAPGQINF